MKHAFFPKFFLALILGLVMIYVFDRLDVSAFSYPVCLSIVLMGISLRQSPSLVAAVSLVYILLVTYSSLYFLYHSNPYHVPFPNRVFGLVQREGVFIVVCAMATYISFYRAAAEHTLADLEKTLSKIPVPVVISDVGGYIIYANHSLKVSLKNLPADLIGRKYVDFFLPGMPEREAILYYSELFYAGAVSAQEIDMVPFGSLVPMLARFICHDTGSNRTLITVLQLPDSTLRPVLPSDYA
jgi:PAS domain-containing protein